MFEEPLPRESGTFLQRRIHDQRRQKRQTLVDVDAARLDVSPTPADGGRVERAVKVKIGGGAASADTVDLVSQIRLGHRPGSVQRLKTYYK